MTLRIFGLVAIRLRVIGLLVLFPVVRLGWVVIMLLLVSAIGRVLVLLLATVLLVLVFTIIIVVGFVLMRVIWFILLLVSVVVVLLAIVRLLVRFIVIGLLIVGFLILTSATIGESVTILDRSRRIGGSLTRRERAFVDVLEAIGFIIVIFLTEAVAPAVLLSKLDLVVRHHVVVHFTQHSRAHTRQRN